MAVPLDNQVDLSWNDMNEAGTFDYIYDNDAVTGGIQMSTSGYTAWAGEEIPLVGSSAELENQKKDGENHIEQDFIEKKQQETIPNLSNIIQLGMTYKEVEKIWGTPELIDEMNDANQYFQMWTYGYESKPSRLYFEANKLIRIEK